MRRNLILSLLCLLLCSAALAGCSSRPDRAEILVSTTPPDASCLLSRLGTPVVTVDPTPGIAMLDRVAAEIVVQCRRHGFQDATAVLPARETGSAFGYVFRNRPLFDYDPRVDIALTPNSPAASRR